jgi:DNA-binding FadR family transcriptional regulator
LLTRLTANLERSQAAIEAGDSVSAINREFHLIIAEQAGNRVLALFMQAVDELLESLDREFPHPPATSLCASQDHRQMLAAVADGDVERLEQRMRAHLARLESSHRGGRETLGDGSPRALRSPESASGSPESASLAQDAALTAPATVR